MFTFTLLCTLVRLCEETPITTSTQNIYLNFLASLLNFLLVNSINFHFSIFPTGQHNKGKIPEPIRAPWSPTCLLPWQYVPPPPTYGEFHISGICFSLFLDKKKMSSEWWTLEHFSMKIVWKSSTYVYMFKCSISCFDFCVNLY